MDHHASALANVRAFLQQSRAEQQPGLLTRVPDLGGGLTTYQHDGADSAGLPRIRFGVRGAHAEAEHEFVCNAAPFGLLALIVLAGQTVFVNPRGSKEEPGLPYLKVFGRSGSKQWTTFARFITEEQDGETVRHTDGNTLDLTHRNLISGRNRKSKMGTQEMYGEVLLAAANAPGELFGATRDEKVRQAQGLLDAVRGRIAEERAAALGEGNQ